VAKDFTSVNLSIQSIAIPLLRWVFLGATLMIYIADIRKILNCTTEQAQAVFDAMCANGFDFSKSSKAKFKKEVIAASKESA
jgi:hypothetical protein